MSLQVNMCNPVPKQIIATIDKHVPTTYNEMAYRENLYCAWYIEN